MKDRLFNNKQWIMLFGLAITSIMAFVSVYDVASGINRKEIQANATNPSLAHSYEVQFIVMMVLSIVAIIFGAVVGKIMQKSKWRFVAYSVLLAGILGFMYSINLRLKAYPKTKMGLSVSLFLLFLLGTLLVGNTGSGIFCNSGKYK